MPEIQVPPEQTVVFVAPLPGEGRRYAFRVRAVNKVGPGAWSDTVTAVPDPPAPPPPEPPKPPWWQEVEPSPDAWVVDWGTYNGWSFGGNAAWMIESVDGFPDMMALKTQDGQLVGDGEIFGWDSEHKRVITITFDAGPRVLLEECFPSDPGRRTEHVEAARCANMRRHDDLPLTLNDRWLILARPRRFLAPQRGQAIPKITVSYEAQDPSIYSTELQSGSIGLGESSMGRPYPPGPGLRYRGPQGVRANSWRYIGELGGGVLSILNEGCRDTYLTLHVSGPVHGLIGIINADTGEALEIDAHLTVSDWLDIDMRLGTILENGTSNRYMDITRASRWWACPPGVTHLRYIFSGPITNSRLTAWWRSAW